MVVVQQSTEPITTHDAPHNTTRGLVRPDDRVVEPLMRALSVIMQHELLNGTPEMSLSKGYDEIEAAGFYRENKSLRVRIQIR